MSHPLHDGTATLVLLGAGAAWFAWMLWPRRTGGGAMTVAESQPITPQEFDEVCSVLSWQTGLPDEWAGPLYKVWRGDHPHCEIEYIGQFIQSAEGLTWHGAARHGTDVSEVWRICERHFGPATTIHPMPEVKSEFGAFSVFWQLNRGISYKETRHAASNDA